MKAAHIDLSNIEHSSDLILEPALREGFSLGAILVYPKKCVVVKQQEHHHVSRKAMEVLFALACNAGKVVSRHALTEYIWGEGQVSSSKLSHYIGELRHLFEDHKEHPVFIQTLPRKGFRLLVPAMPLESALLSSDVLRLTEQLENKKNSPIKKPFRFEIWRQNRLFKIAGTYIVMSWVLMQVVTVTLPIVNAAIWIDKFALLILIICFPLVLLYNWQIDFKLRQRFVRKHQNSDVQNQMSRQAYRELSALVCLSFCCLVLASLLGMQINKTAHGIGAKSKTSEIQADVYANSVAVLTFKQIGNENAQGVISVLQSELLSFLSQSAQLKVVSERVLTSIPVDATLETIRERTGARYVIGGSVNVQTDSILITTNLTDTKSGYQVWSSKATMPLDDQLTLQETISHQVFNALTFLMPLDESNSLQFKPTNDIHAYDFYIRGKTLLREAYNQTQLKEAEDLFLNALSRDNRFDLAKAGLCQTYIEQYELMKKSQIFELAKQSCQSDMGETNIKAESEIALGRLYSASGEYELAKHHYYQAIALQDSNSLALSGIAQVLAKQEKSEQAAVYFLKAIQAEPGYWRNYEDYGSFLFASGKYYEASLQFYKQTILQPQSEEAFNNLGAAYYLNTEFDKATESWKKALGISPSANIYSNLGTSLFFAKKFAQAAQMYQQAVNLNPGNFVFKGNLADALKYAGNGKLQTTPLYLEALKQARDSERVNEHDLYPRAGVARYNAELGQCDAANSGAKSILEVLPDDPYIFYDLALVAINCSTKDTVLNRVGTMLKLGYPPKLLRSDPQFIQYQQGILQLQSKQSGIQQ
jgi:DNA-binding winged helix-turn-helix (wHTH) protein/Tfp pilus assembly protein PilF/TolB-like protein